MNSSPPPYPLPANRLALVFSDPASTNSCIALFEMYKLQNKPLPLLYSNTSYFSPAYRELVKNEIPEFNSLGIDCVFGGTSHPASSKYFESNCIQAAAGNGIHTISFIDHWVNFKLRFQGLDLTKCPDEIWVVDDTARRLATEEGLPGEKIQVRPNPYHYFLSNYWRPSFAGKEYLSKLGIPGTGLHILFAPDPLSIRDGKQSAGFDEEDALHDLLSILAQIHRQVWLIIKCHPLQPIDKLSEVMKKHGNGICFLITQADAPELIHASDLVIGFYSNILLEAEALGKKTIRYFPGNAEADLLKHRKSLPRVSEKTGLLAEIKKSVK